MNKDQRISRWVSGLLLCGAICGLLLQEVAMGEGGRGPGGGGPGGRSGGPGGGSQRSGFRGGGQQAGGSSDQGNCQSMVDKVMSMDSNGDGMLTANEVQDLRLQGMMSVADVDADGVVTQDELRNMFTKQLAQQGEFRGGPGGPPGFGGGEFGGGPPGRGPGGRGPGEMGPGGPPRVGELMPGFVQDELDLSEEQRSRIADLQKAVDKKIQSILSKEQRARYKEMQMHGPGGPVGGPGGGRGPSDGPPPSDPDAGRPQKESKKGSTTGI